jgi:pentatricopeptide repeat protein
MAYAEHWMNKIDAREGFFPEIRAVNALIRGYIMRGNYDKADEWFKKIDIPYLNPEMGGLTPAQETFNYIVSFCANKGEIARAEMYADEAPWFDIKLSLRTFGAMVRGCCRTDQERRGHRWCQLLVEEGCAEVPDGLGPATVAEERERHKTGLKGWEFTFLEVLVCDLAKALVDKGYTASANQWLAYLVEGGLKPEDAAETWDYVRGKHHPDIIPVLLSGESIVPPVGATQPRGAPSLAVPAKLSGETTAVWRAACTTPAALHKKRFTLDLLEEDVVSPMLGRTVTQHIPLGPDCNPDYAGKHTMRADILTGAVAKAEMAGKDIREINAAKRAIDVEKRQAICRAAIDSATSDPNVTLEALEAALKQAVAAGLHGHELDDVEEAITKAKKKRLREQSMRDLAALGLEGDGDDVDYSLPSLTLEPKTAEDRLHEAEIEDYRCPAVKAYARASVNKCDDTGRLLTRREHKPRKYLQGKGSATSPTVVLKWKDKPALPSFPSPF